MREEAEEGWREEAMMMSLKFSMMASCGNGQNMPVDNASGGGGCKCADAFEANH